MNHTKEHDFTIAPLETSAHYRACDALQAEIWSAAEAIPNHVFITAQRHGGLVLGAFDAVGQMIGFLCNVPGKTAPDNLAARHVEWQQCSLIMGVTAAWRGRGVGYHLKLAQRGWAAARGYELVTWTYDPLEAANAVLNLGKLGAVCRCYLRNLYGDMPDKLNAGIPTDRFEVSWWVDRAQVRARLEQDWREPRLADLLTDGAVVLNYGHMRADGRVTPGAVQAPTGKTVLIEIPARFQALKAADMTLALAWRLNARAACEAAFAAGYTACDVIRAEVDGAARVFYLLKLSLEV